MLKIGIIGFGVVGKAINAHYAHHNVFIYDKYIHTYSNYISVMQTDICYVSVPTPTGNTIPYDLSALDETMMMLYSNDYSGIIIIKSTLSPGTIDNYVLLYPKLNIYYMPEFLSAKTAIFDYTNQKHIIIGCQPDKHNELDDLMKKEFPHAEISTCSYAEAESVKIFCNTFYAVKIQVFTEFYLACKTNGYNYDKIINIMFKNGWINPMHTQIPGHDGCISFGGMCLPKDISALNIYLHNIKSDHAVIDAAIMESNFHRKIKND